MKSRLMRKIHLFLVLGTNQFCRFLKQFTPGVNMPAGSKSGSGAELCQCETSICDRDLHTFSTRQMVENDFTHWAFCALQLVLALSCIFYLDLLESSISPDMQPAMLMGKSMILLVESQLYYSKEGLNTGSMRRRNTTQWGKGTRMNSRACTVWRRIEDYSLQQLNKD